MTKLKNIWPTLKSGIKNQVKVYALIAVVLCALTGVAATVQPPAVTQRITKTNSRVAIANGLVPITKYKFLPGDDVFPATDYFTCNVPPGGKGWYLVSIRPLSSGGLTQFYGPFHEPSLIGGGRVHVDPASGDLPVQYFLLQVPE